MNKSVILILALLLSSLWLPAQGSTTGNISGQWFNTGDQVALVINKDLSCILKYEEGEYGETVKLKGRANVSGDKVTIKWEKQWRYGDLTSYEYRQTGQKNILWMVGNNNRPSDLSKNGQLGFEKEEALAPFKEKATKEETKTYLIEIKHPQFGQAVIDRELDKFIQARKTEFKKLEPPRPDDPRHYKNSLYITYDQPYITERYISLVFYVETYDGGAHPNLVVLTKNYDHRTGKLLKLADLTTINKGKLRSLLAAKLLATMEQPDKTMIIAGIRAYNLENFAFDPEAITFHFSPDEVACHAAGAQKASFLLYNLK